MEPQRVRSLELVREVVRDERAAQLTHFDALDTKAVSSSVSRER